MNAYHFRVGAAVGSGMAASAAERAGADFILALGAGKLRSIGIGSPAALLPIYDAVEFTIDFATSELLPRVQLPVYIGLPLFDPRIDPRAIVERLKSLGISGLTNFPAVFHFGKRARTLERHGLGLDREIRFLDAASRAGLDTIGYVRNRVEANAMVSAGISSICINFGLNPPKAEDSDDDDKIDQLTLAIRDIVDHLRKPGRSLTVYLGGGPVSSGAGMGRICRNARIDGFVGGSALDRTPLEKSLLNSVASFREIEVLQDRVKRFEHKLHRLSQRYGIICQSASMNMMMDKVEKAIDTHTHIAVSGEPNSGRMDVARMIADRIRRGSRRKFRELNFGHANIGLEQLFGHVRDTSKHRLVGLLELADAHSPIILAGAGLLALGDQERLAHFLGSGTYCAGGDVTERFSNARLIVVLDGEAGETLGTGVLAKDLAECLSACEISVPPLRDRVEDIPPLAHHFASRMGNDRDHLPSAVVRTLVRHNWPGNLEEFRAAIRWLTEAKNMTASEEELIAHIGGTQRSTGHQLSISRRDRIIQALLLNNLNRTKTAEYLGISRKTLYNQIKKYDILS